MEEAVFEVLQCMQSTRDVVVDFTSRLSDPPSKLELKALVTIILKFLPDEDQLMLDLVRSCFVTYYGNIGGLLSVPAFVLAGLVGLRQYSETSVWAQYDNTLLAFLFTIAGLLAGTVVPFILKDQTVSHYFWSDEYLRKRIARGTHFSIILTIMIFFKCTRYVTLEQRESVHNPLHSASGQNANYASAGLVSGGCATPFLIMDLVETDKEYQIVCDAPGVEPADLDVTLHEYAVTITADRKNSYRTSAEKLHLEERPYGTISRRVQLPKNADIGYNKTIFKNGVLYVVFPKASIEGGEKVDEGKKLEITHE